VASASLIDLSEREVVMRSLKWWIVAAAFAAAFAIGAVNAVADSPPVTRGDAQALFHAGTTGGFSIKLHAGVIQGAPASQGRILPGQNFQGVHICASDWHVMAINLVVTDATDGVRNVSQARAVFSTIAVTYQLDGSPLAIHSSAVTPWLGDPTSLDPNATVAFSQHFGTILAPADLSVGAHTERVRLYQNGLNVDDLGDVTFFVDAAGTGACL
jgi:hypothetical protein